MTFTCPNGHASASDDYCDQCGIRLGQASPPSPTPQAEETVGTTEPEPASRICPTCGDRADPGARFCEMCGTDLDHPTASPRSENHPAAPVAEPAAPVAEPAPPEWQLVASCDREYFSQVEADSIELPAFAPDRVFWLHSDRVAIGRHGQLEPEEQAIDLSDAPADAGISHRHALLARQPDGGWTVVDCHSTNGTFLNDSSGPISCEEPVPIGERDQLHVGAWTTITLRCVPGGSMVPRHPEGSNAAASQRQ
jgi:FHA domain/Double zinc ribbon